MHRRSVISRCYIEQQLLVISSEEMDWDILDTKVSLLFTGIIRIVFQADTIGHCFAVCSTELN